MRTERQQEHNEIRNHQVSLKKDTDAWKVDKDALVEASAALVTDKEALVKDKESWKVDKDALVEASAALVKDKDALVKDK